MVVPPEAVAVAAPSFPPLQLTLSSRDAVATRTVGSVIVMVVVSVHPLASVTVTVYVSALTPVIEAVVAPVLQENE